MMNRQYYLEKGYDLGIRHGTEHAIRVLCEMIDNALAGQRIEYDQTKPHAATFERLVRRLDNKLN
jgi:hypothetical protein